MQMQNRKTRKAPFHWPLWIRAVIFACSAEGLARRHYALGQIWEVSGETERAVTEYEAAVSRWRGLDKAQLALGRCCLRKLDLDRAKEALSACLCRKPSDPEANLYQGVILFYRDDLVGSQTHLRIAANGLAESDPKSLLAAEYMRKALERQQEADGRFGKGTPDRSGSS